MQQNDGTLRSRFINAIVTGKLGRVDEQGIVFTLKEFKQCFSDIKTDYINSFLPASTIEIGRVEMSHTKFLFRIRKGVYRVHPDLLLGLESEGQRSCVNLSLRKKGIKGDLKKQKLE